MRVLGIIPARWGSTRLPGKPLADINGKSMIEHVWRRARQAQSLSRLLVATDDERIVSAVQAFGGEAVMTPHSCASGTDRLAYAAARLHYDVVVNIQGDEPFLPPYYLDRLVIPLMQERQLQMATLSAPLPSEDQNNPNAVKVVCNRLGYALYFSRALIPYPRQAKQPACLHLGLYAYRRAFLKRFSSWRPTSLEQTEQLEQLRALDHGVAIKVVPVPKPTLSIDTPEDLERARVLMRKKKA